MKRVTGIGGIFFKSKDPGTSGAWYQKHLGFEVQPWGGAAFFWRDAKALTPACSVWSPFQSDTKYFAPSEQSFMVNLRVENLDALLESLRAEGVNVLDRREDGENGKFGYVLDPDGVLLELWEPNPEDPCLNDCPAAESKP